MLLSATNITKYHNDKCIFKDISYAIEEKDKIALIGVNGTGKSTFLKTVCGIENYEGAKMIMKKNLTISYLPQDPVFESKDTIFEAIVKSGVDAEEFEIKSLCSKLGILDVNDSIQYLSGGQKKKVALVCALLSKSDLLILDEPTNHLDNEMIEWLEKYLIRYSKAILMVTHDRYFMERICNRIFEIDCSSLYVYEANYSKYLDIKQAREESELLQEKKRNAFLKKELEWVRAGVQARTTKSKDRLERFEKLNSIEKIKQQENVKMISIQSRLGKKTVEINNISMAFENHVLFKEFSYILKRTDRIGILGSNGSGKSTFLNIIAKEKEPLSGEIVYGDTVKIGYYKQGCEDMDGECKVIDYIRDISDSVTTSEGTFTARMMLERFLFDGNLQYSKIKMLSGGERRRLYLLSVLMQAPNVLLLDEPTNDLDIQTLTILEDYLDNFNGILLIVSHDRYFLDRVCDSLFVIQNGAIHRHIGGYSSYIQYHKEETVKVNDGAQDYALQKQKQKENKWYMSSKEKRELEGMEDVILKLEEAISLLDEKMNALTDYKEIHELSLKREQMEQELEVKNERWLLLLEKEEKAKENKQ